MSIEQTEFKTAATGLGYPRRRSALSKFIGCGVAVLSGMALPIVLAHSDEARQQKYHAENVKLGLAVDKPHKPSLASKAMSRVERAAEAAMLSLNIR